MQVSETVWAAYMTVIPVLMVAGVLERRMIKAAARHRATEWNLRITTWIGMAGFFAALAGLSADEATETQQRVLQYVAIFGTASIAWQILYAMNLALRHEAPPERRQDELRRVRELEAKLVREIRAAEERQAEDRRTGQ